MPVRPIKKDPFANSMRMPQRVAWDRETLEDWVACETLNIMEKDPARDEVTARRWARERLEGSAALQRSLIPELSWANPRPLRRMMRVGTAAELLALLFFIIPVNPLIPAILLLSGRTMISLTGRQILMLRDHHSAWMTAFLLGGWLGYGVYYFLYYLPERRKQERKLSGR